MDTRLTTTPEMWWSLAATVALGLVIALGATSASAASQTACRVQSTDTGKTYEALQAAVDAARRGDRLTVRGTCRGTTVVDRGVVIEGLTSHSEEAVLDGDSEGVVVTVRGDIAVTIKTLTIQDGRGRFRKGGPSKPYDWTAGVENKGNLTLRDVLVRNNRGVGVHNEGRLRLNGDTNFGRQHLVEQGTYGRAAGLRNVGWARVNGRSRIRGSTNEGTLVLGGVSSLGDVTNHGTLTMNAASSITGIVTNHGTLTMNDTSQLGGPSHYSGASNLGTMTMNGASRMAGSLGVHNEGSLTLNETSEISGNSRGVYNRGSVTLNGSGSIHDNHLPTPARCGPLGSECGPIGGAGVYNDGSLTLNDSSSIFANTVGEWHARSLGGGVYMVDDSSPGQPSLTMTGSATISGNAAGDQGGGVYAGAGSVLTGVSCGSQTGANVYGNSPDDCYTEP